MDSQSRPSPRLGRGVTACQRCRRRKQKCDLQHPSCSNCKSANVRCLTYHSEKHTEIPRSYVSDLEAQVEKLTRENQELRTQLTSVNDEPKDYTSLEPLSPATHEISGTIEAGPGVSEGGQTHLQDLVKSVRNVVVEPSRQPRFLGASSGITLAKMVLAAIRVDGIPPPSLGSISNSQVRSPSTSMPKLASTVESSLPPHHAAEHLVDVYFQYRTPHLPIVNRSQVKEAIKSAYLSMSGNQLIDQVAERDIFTTYMVFAISLCNVPNPSGGTGRVLQSEGCFLSAISRIEKVVTYSKSDLETLRAVLLLAQFVSMCPWQGSLWHLTGIALRLCVDMGLHWEIEAESLATDPDLLYERRRLWYSVYHFDRVLGITLGRPFGITDENTRVPLPNPWALRPLSHDSNDFDIHHQRAHNHLFSMAKLESEIRHVQQSQTWPLMIAYPKPNFVQWVQDMQPRLQEWYGTIPDLGRAHPSSIFTSQAYWDTIYHNSILLLYRPNYSPQHSFTEALSISHGSACKVIASIKLLQREGKLDVLWKSVHHLFMAGLTVIYGLWQSKELREQNLVGNSVSILQSCASTLSAMSETFHGAAGCRDAFENLSSVTIDWLVNNDAEKNRQTRVEFEKQLEELLQQLQPTRGGMATDEYRTNNIPDLLSSDNFAFGEMLSSAAQWPAGDLQNMDFNDMGLDSMVGIGPNPESYTFL